MYCYRRLGHNESDEPRFTQPLMYKTIDDLPTIRDSYLKRLLKMREVTGEEANKIAEVRREKLQQEFDSARDKIGGFTPDTQTMEGIWSKYLRRSGTSGRRRCDGGADRQTVVCDQQTG